jgi:aspartyl-tRNA(Asn)/glutamyl-tRNA(Gln) amidotransferase subunit A
MTTNRPVPGACDLSVVDLAAELRHHRLSPLEAVSAVCDRIDELDHVVHSVVTLDTERAMATARDLCSGANADDPLPPLWGVPVTVKDLTPTKGIRTTRGSALRQRWGPDVDAVAVERLRRAGAVVVGKTNTSEDGWKAETSNPLFPSTLNPWNQDVTAGGSSGGAAAAVACGFGPLATGTDGAGSVRIPAAFCGVVGFKPTFGAIPYWPPSAEQLSHVGLLCKTVEDVAVVFDVLKGPDPRDPGSRVELMPGDPSGLGGLRVGVVRQSGAWPVDPEIHHVFDRTVDGCTDLGLHLESVPALPDVYDAIEVILSAFEAAPYRHGGLDEHAPYLDPGRLAVIERGLRLSAAELAHALEQRHAHTIALNQRWLEADLLIMPSTSVLPFAVGHTGPPTTEEPIGRLAWAAFSYPWNLTGDPACSLPVGLSSTGLPIGVQLVGPSGRDDRVLACSRHLESSGLVGYRPPPIGTAAESSPPVLPIERQPT